MPQPFNTEKLDLALTRFAQRVDELGFQRDCFVVGGAAVALGVFSERRLTSDVDVRLKSIEELDSVVQEIALELDLPSDWLNDRASRFIAFTEESSDWKLWKRVGTVSIYLASPELLLAMKLQALRIDRDIEDIKHLIEYLALEDFDQVEQVHDHFYPGEGLGRKAEAVIQSIFKSLG